MIRLLLLAILLFVAPLRPAAAADFDYYVLSLSWSPTYCTTQEAASDHAQCAPGRRFAFVAHGLWPQHERGWPEFCATGERWVPEERIAEMLPVMPSRRLVIHQWRKHGSCSGLSQRDYFDLTRELFRKVRIPARYLAPQADIDVTPRQLVHDFVQTNAWLDPSMLVVDCGNRRDHGRLRELRLCFTREGEPRDCGALARRHCRAASLTLPPVR